MTTLCWPSFHRWQAAAHFGAGVTHEIQQFATSLEPQKIKRCSEGACQLLEKPGISFTAHMRIHPAASLHLSCIRACIALLSALIVQPPHAAGNQSTSSQYLFSSSAVLQGAASLRLLLYDTERRAQRTGLRIKAVFIQAFSLKAYGFFGAFRFAGIREMQQHVVLTNWMHYL